MWIFSMLAQLEMFWYWIQFNISKCFQFSIWHGSTEKEMWLCKSYPISSELRYLEHLENHLKLSTWSYLQLILVEPTSAQCIKLIMFWNQIQFQSFKASLLCEQSQ